jgi:hypothetical protein
MEKRIFNDPSIPSFFQAANKPFKILPHRNDNTGQVEFMVEGDGIDSALDEIYANTPVGVLDYIKALKSFRSSIFALKGTRRMGGTNGT